MKRLIMATMVTAILASSTVVIIARSILVLQL